MRKLIPAIALAIASIGFPAAAQTNQSTIPVVVKAAGAPATVTNYTTLTTCTNLVGGGTVSATNTFPATGGAGIAVFSLTGNTSCKVNVTAAGTNTGSGVVTVTVGGVVRFSGLLGTGVTTSDIPVAAATNIEVSIVYPSFTVKKVVVGAEQTPGFAYPFRVACFDLNNVSRTYSSALVDGKFALKAGESKIITSADINFLVATDKCYVEELNNGGGAASYSTTTATGTESGRMLNGAFVSAAFNADGQTTTVTNSFVGDLIVSKVVVGSPATNIGIYEMNVSCSNGFNESFLIKDRQSWVKTGIISGVTCAVTETRSDGATVSYADNSGDNATDGRVVIKATAYACQDTRLAGTPDCRANVIVTNSYAAPTTTAASTTTAATTAVTTAAPALAAPVEEPALIDESELTVG